MNQPNRNVIYEFGDFRVDIRKRQLFKNRAPLQLTAKAFDTLAALMAAHGETMSKAELMDAVWPETAVEENNLTQQISALRKAFGERAGDHKYIVTVPGRGYSFVARVVRVDDYAEIDQRPGSTGRRRAIGSGAGSSRLFGYGLAVMYVLVVCVPAFVVSWRAESHGLRPQSIAIMRFRSAGVGDELLGMGIRDTLRAKLGSLDDVTVRPSGPDVTDDVVNAGRQLNVDVVVTGSIQHDEDKVRVAVEMVDISSERIVWGSTFDGSSANSFPLQDSITNAVLSALSRPRSSSALRPAVSTYTSDIFAVVFVEKTPTLRRTDCLSDPT